MEEHPLRFIAALAEQRITEAQEAGAFDNLPGYGKPLELEDDSHIPPELRMSYKILKNAGYIPPELAERKEIDSLLDMLEHSQDEQLRLRQMRKLEVLVLQAKSRRKRSLALEQADPYYEKVLRRISILGGRREAATDAARKFRAPALVGGPRHRQEPPRALS